MMTVMPDVTCRLHLDPNMEDDPSEIRVIASPPPQLLVVSADFGLDTAWKLRRWHRPDWRGGDETADYIWKGLA